MVLTKKQKTEVKNQLKQFLSETDTTKWTETPDIIDGIYFCNPKGSSLVLKLLPNDKETGKPIRRKGIFFTTPEQIDLFLELMANPEVKELLGIIAELNGSTTNTIRITRE